MKSINELILCLYIYNKYNTRVVEITIIIINLRFYFLYCSMSYDTLKRFVCVPITVISDY